MDWFSWLSKTSLDSSIIYEYALSFSQNELQKEDIPYFNHEFLQSMGITIAKHRLEILKLARREKTHGFNFKNPMKKLFHILKKTKESLTNCIATLIHHGEDSRAMIVFSNKINKLKRKNKFSGAISCSSRWKNAMMMGDVNDVSKKFVMVNSGFNQERLMLTNSDYYGDYDGGDDDLMVVSKPKLDSCSSPLMYDLQKNHKEEKIHDDDDDDDYDDDDDQGDDKIWAQALEEIKWDVMFQDLKPT